MFESLRLRLSVLSHARALWRWQRAEDRVATADLALVRRLRRRARELHARLERVLQIADARLTLPRLDSNAIRRPPLTDWAFRPEAWRVPIRPMAAVAVASRTWLGEAVTVFHDCAISEITVRQVRNTREEDLAPFGLRLDVFRFDGTFLSLVIDAPSQATEGLRRSHVIRAEAIVESETPLEIFLRLNIKHGPNTEQIVRELPPGTGERAVDFDLGYSELNEKRVERIWLDMIFEGAEMNQVTIRDLTLSRRPRAAI